MNSENINEIATALSKAQAEITHAIESSSNPHFRSNYSKLPEIWDACREPLSKNGLSVTQVIDEKDNKIILITTLMHSSGQYITSKMPLMISKNDMQGFGSALTYARRYSLSAIVGVASSRDDDDGNCAVSSIYSSTQGHFPAKKEKISINQSKEIMQSLEQCDENFKKYVFNKLKSEYKIDDLSNLTVDVYQQLLNAIQQNKVKKKVENEEKSNDLQ